MAYEGGYLDELKAEHARGEHEETRCNLCPTCDQIDNEEYAREEGFASAEERDTWIAEQCNKPDPELEEAIAAVFKVDHVEGKHDKYPSRDCPICIVKHGFNNI